MKKLYAGVPIQYGKEFEDKAIRVLNLSKWHNWYITGRVPMMWRVGLDTIYSATKDEANTLWFLGNEPERSDQSSTRPDEFAKSVQIWTGKDYALPGIMINDHWQYWMNEYLSNKGPIPKYWLIHIYGWNGNDWEYLWNQFKIWMRNNSVERPVIVNECASWDEKSEMQIEVMNRIITLLRSDKLLHECYWFSAHYGTDSTFWQRTDLLNRDLSLTEIGQHFLQVTQDRNIFLPFVTN